ncbi:helix-turn-helix domain-containing protein [Lonsdalea quercina]|uniref:helix-turn-helix domain-containing protein n=1 Tax=Lonsdalea quercina TaxID=71657 RepID=UPI003976B4BC
MALLLRARRGFRSKELTVDDEVLTVSEIASLLKVHPQTIKSLVTKGVLPATDIGFGTRHKYRFVKSACLAAMSNTINTPRVNAGDMTESKPCQSNSVTAYGTATSRRQMERELDALLKR